MACKICQKKHYAKGLCKKHYFQDYRKKSRYSLNKVCSGTCYPPNKIMDASILCRRCIQLALRNRLVKQVRTQSGATVFMRWDNKRKVWRAMGLNISDANKVMEDLIQQQNLIIRRDDARNIIQVDKVTKVGRFVDVERIRWDD